jgi:hypothetical protein
VTGPGFSEASASFHGADAAASGRPELLALVRRWALAVAECEAAEAAVEAAERRLAPVPVPDALRYRAGDHPAGDHRLFGLSFAKQYHLTEKDGVRYFNEDWIDELRRTQRLGIWWADPNAAKSKRLHTRRLAKRGAEILAAAEQFEAAEIAALAASGLEQAEEEFGAALIRRHAIEFLLLSAPADSASAFVIKLGALDRLLSLRRGTPDGAPGWRQLIEEDNSTLEFAVVVALDLAALMRRAQAAVDDDPDLAAFRPLADIAAVAAASITTEERARS